MEKTQIIILAVAVVSGLFNLFLTFKTFRFKDALWTLIEAAKDGRIDENEFQQITDDIKKDLYGK